MNFDTKDHLKRVIKDLKAHKTSLATQIEFNKEKIVVTRLKHAESHVECTIEILESLVT